MEETLGAGQAVREASGCADSEGDVDTDMWIWIWMGLGMQAHLWHLAQVHLCGFHNVQYRTLNNLQL